MNHNVCFAFVSDSCNGMRDVRKVLCQRSIFTFAYGFSTHCLKNFCGDLGKLLLSDSIRNVLYVSRRIEKTTLTRELFEVICDGKVKTVLRYGSLLEVKMAVYQLHVSAVGQSSACINISFVRPRL